MKLVPCLLFEGRADEALAYYASLLPGAKTTDVLRGQGVALIAATLEFDGGRIMLLNGPAAQPSMAVSIFLECETQTQVDRLWDALSDGGKPIRCGWITDRFGVTWQIVPKGMPKYLGDLDPARAQRAMQAMMGMTKLDINEIARAADGA
jgi:predicted 3-demethylubiquinone-9 3-methyltransferase (glyoxalase superfamily)